MAEAKKKTSKKKATKKKAAAKAEEPVAKEPGAYRVRYNSKDAERRRRIREGL
jgi:hypothetical protein|tara:strand:+ start:2192 stop:2350 length:159 start_codon:yes stop_codon:yes gene_type:complete